VVSANAQDVIVQVIDQGRGFCTDVLRRPLKTHRCFGLSHVRERVGEVGGSVKIRSHLGKGTNVRLAAPAIEGSKTTG
jgi:signal transduction histidine kinase